MREFAGPTWEGPHKYRPAFQAYRNDPECRNWSLLIPVAIGDRVFATLIHRVGSVRTRKDGRFDWFRKTIPAHHLGWDNASAGQGVADTLEEAKAQCEKGLIPATAEAAP